MSNRLSKIAKRIMGNGNGHVPEIDVPSTRILIAIPCQDDMKSVFSYDLVRLCLDTAKTRPDWGIYLKLFRGTLIASQRQGLAESAVADGATHILWLDSDMHFPPDALLRLMERRQPIVGANYTTRRPPIKPTAMRLDVHEAVIDGKQQRVGVNHDVYSLERKEENGVEVWSPKTGLEPVSWIGFGCVLTETRVFQSLDKPWFFVEYKGDKHGGYFSGEDVFFCQHAVHNGWPVFVDHDLSKDVQHIGEMDWGHEHVSPERYHKAVQRLATPLEGLVEVLP